MPKEAERRKMKAAIVVAGPTASGKSHLALAIAEAFGGIVINADALQVYADLPVLTAQPDQAARARAPHRLYGFLGMDAQTSAVRWAALAAEEMRAAWQSGCLPVLVGGTGLYLRALMEGFAPLPAIDPAIEAATQALLEEGGAAALHQRLAVRDPIMAARLHPNDSQRVARAWSVMEATGRSLADWQKAAPEAPIAARYYKLLLDPARAALYAACDARFRAMLLEGAWDETRAAIARYGPGHADLPGAKALGYRLLASVLTEGADLETAIAAAQQATRHYAKRQVTWFRHQFVADHHFMSYSIDNKQFSESFNVSIRQKIREFLLTGD